MFFCIFMNDFGVNRHTFMNDFGVLFHQNARIFLVIPLCQRSPFVASRRFMCHRHVVNVIYVVCRRATLVLLLCWLVILGAIPPRTEPMGCCLFILYVLFPPLKGYRTLAEGAGLFVPSICNHTPPLSFGE